MSKKTPPLYIQVRVLARQATDPRTGEPLIYDQIRWDHIHPEALGGPSTADNFQALNDASHKEKTFGKPATTLGSDIHAIAKTKRIAKKEAERDTDKYRQELLAKTIKKKKVERERQRIKTLAKRMMKR